WWTWLLLPWNLTLSNPDSYNFCGPLALGLLPFLFLFRLRHPVLKFLAGAAFFLLIASLAVTHILRFALPFFILFYILLGTLLGGADRSSWGKVLAWVSGFTGILCFAYLAAISHYYYSTTGIWAGRQTREEYLMSPGKITPYFSMAQWLTEHALSGARLLIVGDARGLYYAQPFLTNTVFDEQALSEFARSEKDGQGIAHRIKELGIEYLVVNGAEGIRVASDYHHYEMTKEEWKRLDDFIQNRTEIVYRDDNRLQAVYHVLSVAKNSGPTESLDLILFFSKPASQFVKDVQRKQWKEAETNLNETLKL